MIVVDLNFSYILGLLTTTLNQTHVHMPVASVEQIPRTQRYGHEFTISSTSTDFYLMRKNLIRTLSFDQFSLNMLIHWFTNYESTQPEFLWHLFCVIKLRLCLLCCCKLLLVLLTSSSALWAACVLLSSSQNQISYFIDVVQGNSFNWIICWHRWFLKVIGLQAPHPPFPILGSNAKWDVLRQ